jgi:hypothetical protein
MIVDSKPSELALLDERAPRPFRFLFGRLLHQSSKVETAILRIRLGAVDLSTAELAGLKTLRVLVAEVNAHMAEAEAYAMAVDPVKRENLERLLEMLRQDIMEIRAAPLGGWSPDFSVFSSDLAPERLLLGPHWFHKPFPHRGPAWAVLLGSREAARAQVRFRELWDQAHDIGPAIQRMMERTSARGKDPTVDTPNRPG